MTPFLFRQRQVEAPSGGARCRNPEAKPRDLVWCCRLSPPCGFIAGERCPHSWEIEKPSAPDHATPPFIDRRSKIKGWGTTGSLLCRRREFSRLEHLAHFRLALPLRPVLLVKFHEAHRRFDRFLPGFQFKLRIPPNHFLSLGEWPVGHGYVASRQADASARPSLAKTTATEHGAGFRRLFAELGNGIHKCFRRRALSLGMFDDHHEFHFHISLALV